MTHTQTRMMRALVGATLLAAAMPSVALAEEEENMGMRLLLPNMAEFVPACIAFLIIWFIMAKFAWPMVLKMMDEREQKIAGDIQAAEDAKAEAEQSATASKERLSAAEREAADIIAAAKREAEEERSKVIAEAQASAVAIIAKAHDAIDSERKKAMSELSGQVVDLSVEIAAKIIGDALDDAEEHRLAEKYLMEVGNLNED